MSSMRADDKLVEFLRAHPDYFEGPKDQQVIRADLKASAESYARAIDLEAYEALRDKVLQFQLHTEECLKRRVANLIQKKDLETQHLQGIVNECAEYERKLSDLDTEISDYESKRQAYETGVGNSALEDYRFLIVGILGICFLYFGVILQDEIEGTFILIGCACFVAASLLQKKCKKRVALEVSPMKELSEKMEARSARLHEVWKLRKFSLLERKKQSMRKIHEFENEIQLILNRVDGTSSKT